MRLTLSLVLWLASLTTIVLGIHGWVQLQAEKADLTASARRELVFVTTAIRTATENAIRDNQEPDVTALLAHLEMKDPTVDVFVFEEDGNLLTSSWGSRANLLKARSVIRTIEATDALRIEELASGEFVAVTPLHVQGLLEGRLVILRAPNVLYSDLAAERWAIFFSMGLLIVVLSTVIWIVVHFRVHRPISRVIAGVQRVSSGDLSARINISGKDEVAELAAEFNAMAQTLEDTQYQLARETEMREKLELDMQRANKMAIVGEFAATLAHEIGSPLQVLNGRARDIAARMDLPEDVKRSVTILVEQTDRIHHIVERLLGVARRKAPSLQEVNIQNYIERMVELFSSQARRKKISLEVEIGVIPTIWVDPDQLQQVLLNLLQNALRACPHGGVVRVTVFVSAFKHATELNEQPSVAVMVEDNGPGISEAIQEQIFEPFFTAWDSGTEGSGTGLGLSVVKSIVMEHRGAIYVLTKSSQVGACFVVHFPMTSTPNL